GGLRYEQTMRGPRDILEVTLPEGVRPRPLRVSLGGGDERREIGWFVVGGVEVTALELHVRRVGGPSDTPLPPPAPHLSWAGQPQVIKACGDAFEGADNESA